MDVLPEVLKAGKLEGALFFNAEFSPPWSTVTTRSAAFAPYLSPGAGHIVMYHLLAEGRAYVALEEGPREELNAGDIIVIRTGTHT